MTILTDYLDGKGIEYEVLSHERTFAGIEEARALGIEADEVLKTVILDTREGHVALVLPSGERLDMRLVREAVDDPEATLATESEISHDFGGFELGALPPVAPLLGVDTIVDATVRDHGPVVFAAGTQTESVKVEAQALFGFQPVRYAQIAEAWAQGRA
ncbi:MAG TPA: YbaK/EbsC family protein [Actinomycetota bacterium]|jgi:Ala-tRNA(Pro) deacylase|nr:YbaK/EbsC family protein [Actinomycetota bacterium]